MEDNSYSVKDRGFIFNSLQKFAFSKFILLFSSCREEMLSMTVVVHRSVNEAKREHADNEYAFH